MRAWKGIIDDIVGPRLLALEAGLSLSAARLMIQWLGDGYSVPWVRSVLWWRCVCILVKQPGVTIAGSAALFVEMIYRSRDPRFSPNDIDVWMDHSGLGWRSLGSRQTMRNILVNLRRDLG